MDSKTIRHVGVLLHPTSLLTRYGIGDFGPAAFSFVDSLKNAGIDLWQVLPLGPTGYGNSPYAARSAFAGNELLLSPDLLLREGYLREEELSSPPSFPPGHVSYTVVSSWKMKLLKKAALRFLEAREDSPSFAAFRKENAFWLEDYALFMVLYEKYHDARWHTLWDRDVARRNEEALHAVARSNRDALAEWEALQFLWFRQWLSLRRHANESGVSIIGDIPIFVAADSCDTWSHLDLFQSDGEGHFTRVSGVPPDNFCSTGQLWGNPVYDWSRMQGDGYSWWLRRLSHLSQLTDYVRIDHFRGFESYWSVPAKDSTAEHGEWVKAPGADFFKTVKKALPDLKILAEDLGFMTKEVEKLRDDNGFPAMKIAQFAFNLDRRGRLRSKDTFLPHNYGANTVVYTGTHDNETVRGWFDHQEKKLQDQVLAYLDATRENVVDKLIRSLLRSHSSFVITPMQDLLALGNEARMNTPSTCGDENWAWRLRKEDETEEAIRGYGSLAALYGRGNSVWKRGKRKRAKGA